MADAYIFDHVRTPRGVGDAGGALHEISSVRLAAHILKGLKERSNLTTALVDDIILGCAEAVKEAGSNIAKSAAFLAEYDTSVSGVQINRFCASGLEAVNMAAAYVMSNQQKLIVAGGVESISRVGTMSSGGAWSVDPCIALRAYYMPLGISADLIATKYGFSRNDVDAYARESRRRAATAWSERRFKKSVLPVTDINGFTLLEQDEHVLSETGSEELSTVPPAFKREGKEQGYDGVAIQAHPEIEYINHVHHERNSASFSDGAAAVLIGSRMAGRATGLSPRARIRSFTSTGSDPALMLAGSIDATEKLLQNSRMQLSDIDLFEVNEIFAAVPLRYQQAFEIDPERVNVNGGAIAMGHPMGATGAMLIGAALDELERRDLNTALVTLGAGAGMATATVIERV
ncbi:acetyl-CoA C-acetyltransferase [Flexibacterium corallicola]|uniref:acetyl-CoA C-acetyltransferase n=1 Tax=Flexibacterium corallicola TaxID=3037259 RepID=UPI00286EC776|nr:acetyl-CoA C-acetyltransferase [Pseudovibrio sp. M1P-2-3]